MKTPMTNRVLSVGIALVLTALAPACGDDDGATPDAAMTPDTGATPDGPAGTDAGTPTLDLYAFDSRFMPGTSSVAYTGQSFRQVLIADLTAYIGGLTTAIDSGMAPADGATLLALNFYYEFDATTGGDAPLLLTTTPSAAQATYGAFNSNANLRTKVAGTEPAIDHKVWATEFTGWSEGGTTTPDGLVLYWFGLLDDLAYQRGLGIVPTGPDGASITKVQVTAAGQDLQQLLQKFLLMAITYHQATDKYLDSATAGKGLLAPNTQDTDKPYTVLEHAWDEGFGYFGAARDYARHTDMENASPGYFDTDADGAIDLRAEFNFGASSNAVKRDLGSDPAAPTDFSGLAMQAFLNGRAIIADAQGELDATQLAALEAERNVAIANWEQAIAATVVHYINEVLVDMGKFGTATYAFNDHAKHWSELKGFALGLQFNPFSPLSDADFVQLHTLLADAPALPNAGQPAIDAYRANLLAARDLLQAAYGFDEANMGDDNGENGW